MLKTIETWNISCPRCSQFHKQKRGFRILANGKRKQVYYCVKCNHVFAPPNSKIAKLNDEIKQKIIKLHKTAKPFKNKYDNLKKSTYSTREVSIITGVSHSAVAKTINSQ